MIACRSRHRKNIVERHGNIRDYDLPSRLRECFAWCVAVSCRQRGLCCLVVRTTQLTPHLPTDPKQQNSARKKESHNLEQLDRNAGKGYSQNRGSDDADENRPRERCSGGKPAAARPITTALSPASTRSIMITWISAAIAPCENISRSIIRSAPGWRQPHVFDDYLNLAKDGGGTSDKGKCTGEVPGGKR